MHVNHRNGYVLIGAWPVMWRFFLPTVHMRPGNQSMTCEYIFNTDAILIEKEPNNGWELQ